MTMKKVKVCESLSVLDFEHEVNTFLNEPDVKVLNIQFQTTSVEGEFLSSVQYSALIEYEQL